MDKEKIIAGAKLILEGIGEDLEREGLVETPERIARMYEEVFSGLGKDAEEILSKTFEVENNDLVIERYKYIGQGQNWRAIPDHLMQNYADKGRCHSGIYKRLRADQPSVVISNYRKSMLIHPYEDRGISVREAARLQSFPDTFIFEGPLMHIQQQIGNAVPVNLAQYVAVGLKNYINKKKLSTKTNQQLELFV